MSKPTKIFIGLPCYDGWSPKFAVSLISSLSGGPPCILHTLDGDSLIPRARNNLAAEFLASDASHMLFLDTDLEFSRDAFHRLVSHDLDVVGGVYLQKRLDKQIPVFNKLSGQQPDEDGMVEVKHVGTGMMMIARHVFERLVEVDLVKRFHTCDDEAKQEWRHEFFPIGANDGERARMRLIRDIVAASDSVEVMMSGIRRALAIELGDNRYESEDWAFCRLVREAGMLVHVDTHVYAKHHGAGVYPNDAVEAMRAENVTLRVFVTSAVDVLSSVLQLFKPGNRSGWDNVKESASTCYDNGKELMMNWKSAFKEEGRR